MTLRDDMQPEDLELTVLSAMKTPEAVRAAADSGLTEDSWQIEAHARTWEYLMERAKFGEGATRNDVAAATGVELLADVTDYRTFLEEMVKQTIYRRATSSIVTRAEMMRGDNPRQALELLIGDLAEIIKTGLGRSSYLDSQALARFDAFMRASEAYSRGEPTGIRTGLRALDEGGDVFRKGQLIAIQGPLNIGKSTLLAWFCARAYYYDGCKVLFLTPESTREDIAARVDPMLARFMGYELSNTKLRNGTENSETYRRYLQDLELSGRRDWVTRDSGDAGVFTVADIVQQVREHQPDVLGMDGIHLLGGPGKTWEKIKEASETIKGLSQHMPMLVIGCTQVQRDAVVARDETSDLGQAGYGMAFSEAANKVFTLAAKQGNPLQRIWKMPKNRDGAVISATQYMKFDVDRGDIGDLRPIEDHGSGLVDFV